MATTPDPPSDLDLLCLGIACYDLIFVVDHHPERDEKTNAVAFLQCGGGLAANGAVAAARLGHRVAYAGYLGQDLYGRRHLEELAAEGIDTRMVVRGDAATSVSSIYVKPDGTRSIVNYKEDVTLPAEAIDLDLLQPRAILLDGHHMAPAQAALTWAKQRGVPTVLDADRLHNGTLTLARQVDYLVASERFAAQVVGGHDPEKAIKALRGMAPNVVITQGEKGLIWCTQEASGRFPAYRVETVDTTGAGDAFHGAFAAGLAAGFSWEDLLAYASATGALCTTVFGARPGMPRREAVESLIRRGIGSA